MCDELVPRARSVTECTGSVARAEARGSGFGGRPARVEARGSFGNTFGGRCQANRSKRRLLDPSAPSGWVTAAYESA